MTFWMAATLCAVAAQEEMPLYPDSPPLYSAEVAAKLASVREEAKEHDLKGKKIRVLSGITRPTLTVVLPPADQATGAAVVICPGGGYSVVAIDHEGHDIAKWFASFGVAGIVLKYRLPRADITGDGTPWPLLDAQRAIRTARANAERWRIKPDRVGVMGFSAGGHLASTAATHFDAGDASAKDPIARQSCRPDFAILVYAAISLQAPFAHVGSRRNLLGADASAERIASFSNELQVKSATPPAFLVHTKDDPVKFDHSVLFAEALQRAGVPAELALYEKGGHGYGLGIHGGEVAGWPDRCKAWMKTLKLLGP
jgi:acetyl esterase/lipase